MSDSTLTSKGQVTIPKDVRERLGLKAGDRVTFTPMPDGTVLMRAKTGRMKELGGILFEEGRAPVPTEKLSF